MFFALSRESALYTLLKYIKSRTNSSLVDMVGNELFSLRQREVAFNILLSRPPIQDVLVLQLPDEYYDAYIGHVATFVAPMSKMDVHSYYVNHSYRILIRAGRPDLLKTVRYKWSHQLSYGATEAILQRDWKSLRFLLTINSSIFVESLPIQSIEPLTNEEIEYVFSSVRVENMLDSIHKLTLFNKRLPPVLTKGMPLVQAINDLPYDQKLRAAFSLTMGAIWHNWSIDQLLASAQNESALNLLRDELRVTSPSHTSPTSESDLELLYENNALDRLIQIGHRVSILPYDVRNIGPVYFVRSK